MKNEKRKIKRKKEKRIFMIGISLFVFGFMCLCQHMGIIRLGYVLTKEKEAFKELSDLNRSLYFEKSFLRSPRYLNKVASNNLGLNLGAEVCLRKINVVSPSRDIKNKRWSFKFNSKALAKPIKKPDNKTSGYRP